mmetsp:Transcript_85115/g.150536  ORF Transcript_85115/g.150536 Transcript_85115/m.150536 type:complete len:458 (-) Transcript_85115:117-1490(-)
MQSARAMQLTPLADLAHDPLVMETTCVTIAKGQQRLGEVLSGTSPNIAFKGSAYALHRQMERDFKSNFTNGIVQFSAHTGELVKAERWMLRLDQRRGLDPEVKTFNALLEGLLKQGDFDKADEWFDKPAARALHPEMGNLSPDFVSYDIMIQASAKAGNLVRAEKYLSNSLFLGFRPHRDSFIFVIEAMLAQNEPKRAHNWMEEFIVRGCSKSPSYQPEVVKNCIAELRSARAWDPEAFLALVDSLARSLADADNSASADRWLHFLFECGRQPADAMETWEHVRARTPNEIRPARLYCESPDRRREVSKQMPALLSGEREKDRDQFLKRRVALKGKAKKDNEEKKSAGYAPQPASRSPSPSPAKDTTGRISQASTRAPSSLAAGRPGSRSMKSRRTMIGGLQQPLPADLASMQSLSAVQRLIRANKRSEEVAKVCAARQLGMKISQGETPRPQTAPN